MSQDTAFQQRIADLKTRLDQEIAMRHRALELGVPFDTNPASNRDAPPAKRKDRSWIPFALSVRRELTAIIVVAVGWSGLMLTLGGIIW